MFIANYQYVDDNSNSHITMEKNDNDTNIQ
jgi:hypothetical protein